MSDTTRIHETLDHLAQSPTATPWEQDATLGEVDGSSLDFIRTTATALEAERDALRTYARRQEDELAHIARDRGITEPTIQRMRQNARIESGVAEIMGDLPE